MRPRHLRDDRAPSLAIGVAATSVAEATVASDRPIPRELLQRVARHGFQRAQRSFAVLRRPEQSLGDVLPALVITSAVRKVATNTVQNYVHISVRSVIEFQHGTIRKRDNSVEMGFQASTSQANA